MKAAIAETADRFFIYPAGGNASRDFSFSAGCASQPAGIRSAGMLDHEDMTGYDICKDQRENPDDNSRENPVRGCQEGYR